MNGYNKAIMNSASLLVVFGLTSGFIGDFFVKDDVLEGINTYIANVKSQTRPSANIGPERIKSLSVYVPYSPPANIADPFAVKGFVSIVSANIPIKDVTTYCQTNNCGDGPPAEHVPYFLERYSIDQLSMVGSLSDKTAGREALIQTPDSGVLYARVGEYIGKNNGLILKITPSQVVIREKIRSANGWKDKMEQIKLSK